MVALEPNQKTVTRFLRELTRDWGSGEALEIRCIREHYKSHSTRFFLHALDEASKHICAMNRTHNTYACINPVPDMTIGSAKDNDINRSFFAFVDADDKGAADRARSFNAFEIAMEVITGTRPHLRNHIYYRFDEPITDMQRWKALQRSLIQHLGTDVSIHNPSRIMRVAGTI